ncbi:MAG: element excision factor XisI family protein, partial [Microcystis panniformis]
MDKLTNYRQIIQNTLTKLDTIANSSSKKKLETCLIFDENHDHYLWMSIGWINKKKINNIQIHIRIKNERVYIEQDWTEIG